MTNGIGNLRPNLPDLRGPTSADGSSGGVGQAGGFADTFEKYLDEVNQLQREASQSVQSLVTGQTDDLAGVMTAMEKSDVAFKTLLAIRSKLMDAYDELRNMPI